jgi:mitochondrial ATPase complex subunit ATP10
MWFGSPAATASATVASTVRCVLKRNEWKRLFRSTVTCSSDGRLDGVNMHPESIGKEILPGGNFVLKFDTRSGEYRQVLVERNFGSFWMMKELHKVDNKPILASFIPADQAILMPTIEGTILLSTEETVDLPHFLLRNNRTKDPNSQCTILGVSFKEFGYQLTETWLSELDIRFATNPRVEVVSLTMTEGNWVQRFLSGLVTRSAKQNTPIERQGRTLIHFGNENLLKDCWRMHNTLTGYIYVLDGIGRVRWAGSGKASPEELNDVEKSIQEILPSTTPLARPWTPKVREVRR